MKYSFNCVNTHNTMAQIWHFWFMSIYCYFFLWVHVISPTKSPLFNSFNILLYISKVLYISKEYMSINWGGWIDPVWMAHLRLSAHWALFNAPLRDYTMNLLLHSCSWTFALSPIFAIINDAAWTAVSTYPRTHFQSISGQRDRLGEKLLGQRLWGDAKCFPKWLDSTSSLKRGLSVRWARVFF